MGGRQAYGGARLSSLLAGVIMVVLAGCALLPDRGFLDPTQVGRFGVEAGERGIRRILTPRDTPPGPANAEEPRPEDLVAYYEEYRLGPGDRIALSVLDLMQLGEPFSAVLEINSIGEIRLPELGSVKVAGLTEQELEQELMVRLRESGLLPRPRVQVFTQLRRSRTFTLLGAVAAPGQYAITQPDMRAIEAIGMGGGAAAQARHMYVIRRMDIGPDAIPAVPPPDVEMLPEDELIVPPDDIDEMGVSPTLASRGGAGGMDEPPAEGVTRAELDEVMHPADTQPAETTPEQAPFDPIVIFDPETGELLDVLEREPEAPAEPEATPPSFEEDIADDFEEPFDWEDVEEVGADQRVIEIDLVALREGNPRMNIVVRDRDVINVPQDTGVFYMMGEINRPGVYAFGGREITLKQALAISGGLSALAWPGTCEVIRREPSTDTQRIIPVNLDAIFAGQEDDFYLRDDDIINVGSNIVAPFLFVIRNSFRFTYGFGFVYDRNFADKDAYGSRLNPEIRDQQARAQRGLTF
jgi:polysaccharide export outer membrane protein